MEQERPEGYDGGTSSAALPQVAQTVKAVGMKRKVSMKAGEIYPSGEEILHCVQNEKNKDTDKPNDKSKVLNKLAQKPVKLPVHMESMRHDIEFRQSNRSADFIAGVDEAESSRRFINRGRLLHTLFSAIETEADIDDAISRLVFDGIIGRTETEEEIRELTRKGVLSTANQGLVFGRMAVIQRMRHHLAGERRTPATAGPDRVMMRDGVIVVVDFKFGKPNKKYNKQVQGYIELLVRMGYDANTISGYLWYVEEEIIEKV